GSGQGPTVPQSNGLPPRRVLRPDDGHPADGYP
ncbi:MAG: hypothetical protein AVDCRST_MAG93-8737, partial [uncultured Chloroflexia bacterium]